MNAPHRKTFEDGYRVVRTGFAGESGSSFFAVFDGHGGRAVVDFLAANLDRNVAAELEEVENENGGGGVEEALTCAFLATDVASSRHAGLSVGSTAAVLVLRLENARRVLYAANVGDTRAVLSRRRKAIRLTVDHKANDPDEAKRVEAMGGFVLRRRVMGVLSVTRSFGDLELKRYVVARPSTSRTVLSDDDDDDEFVVLACDGLWDVFSDQEAVDFVADALASGASSPDDVASQLVSQALKRGTTDNVTCVVVGLTRR